MENTNQTNEPANNIEAANATEPCLTNESATISLEQDLEEAKNKYLRLYAEFDNFKKRSAKERTELLQTAGKDIIIALIPVLDDFERGLKLMENNANIEPIKEGVTLVYLKLKNILLQKGLKEMGSLHESFDPELHEAISTIPADDINNKHKIIDEIEKGYFMNDKVIRHAKVVVAN